MNETEKQDIEQLQLEIDNMSAENASLKNELQVQ